MGLALRARPAAERGGIQNGRFSVEINSEKKTLNVVAALFLSSGIALQIAVALSISAL